MVQKCMDIDLKIKMLNQIMIYFLNNYSKESSSEMPEQAESGGDHSNSEESNLEMSEESGSE